MILRDGEYAIDYYLDGYLPAGQREITVNHGEVTYKSQKLLYGSASGGTAIAAGTVTDAVNGNPIENADIKFREGWCNKYGDYVTSGGTEIGIFTDKSGYYSTVELKAGEYTAEIKKDGYVTGYVDIIASPGSLPDPAVLTPVLNDNEYRAVLTWGDSPRDLDSHITGPLSSGGRFHTYYSNRQSYDNGTLVANLDIDDTCMYGPETTTVTIIPDANGVYRYSVHDYSDKADSTSKYLSLSGAQVQLYKGNNLVATYYVPINQTGTLWTVFEINNGVVTPVNTISYESNPSAVQ